MNHMCLCSCTSTASHRAVFFSTNALYLAQTALFEFVTPASVCESGILYDNMYIYIYMNSL